jgi:hypothetical protein
MSLFDRDDAVTPVIGTVIVLAITIMGIGTALYLGTPVLVNLRERAALENVIGQFEQVRAAANDMYIPDESRYPTISIPAGELTLAQGSHVLVTVDEDASGTTYDGCDFRVQDWSDWDVAAANKVSLTASGCPAIAGITNATCNAAAIPAATGACFEAYRVNGSAPASWPLCAASTAGPCHLTWTVSGAEYSLSSVLDDEADYMFRLTDSTTAVVYAQAWLFHMDRLAWRTGNVAASYEGGGILAQEGEGYFLASSPLVTEDPPGGPFFLRLPTMQGSDHGAFSGSGSHSVGLIMTAGHLRVDWVAATLIRLDFHGDLAEPWCNAFLLRDQLASLDGDYYTEDATHLCSGTAEADGVRSVKYDEPATFRFTLTQTVIHASLLL